MTNILFSILLFSSFSHAARIIEAIWNPGNQTIEVTLAFQGGNQPHQFSVHWDACAFDQHEQKTYRLGQILDSGWQDTGSNQLQKTFIVSEPNDGCVAQFYLLKSTSSKEPTVVGK